jgi:hypothetical protein
MSVISITYSEARNLVLQNMRQRQVEMSRAGRQVRTFWGYWTGKAVLLSIGEAIAEVQNNTELGKFIVTVELNGIAQQTGVTYQLEM